MHTIRTFSVLCFLILISALLPSALYAAPPAPLTTSETTDGIRISWQGKSGFASLSNAGWPLLAIGGQRLPAQMLALQIPTNRQLTPQFQQLRSEAWYGALAPIETITPQTINGEARPDLAVTPDTTLPDSPIVVLRDGLLRGERIVVLAISQIYEVNKQIRRVTALDATFDGATLFEAQSLPASWTPQPSDTIQAPHTAARSAGWTITVTKAGIQQISAATLKAAGLDLAAIDRTRLRLTRQGNAVAIEASSSELRFYAPTPGDRWNATDRYWLSLVDGGGPTIGTRDASGTTAPLRNTTRQRGVWRHPQNYDSLQAGPSGDHWFSTSLRATSTANATFSIALTTTLPLATGTTVLTPTGSAYAGTSHELRVAASMNSDCTNDADRVTWSGLWDWSRQLTIPTATTQVDFCLVTAAAVDGTHLDQVGWERSVTLNFNNQGAFFDGVAGNWRYQLSGTPVGRLLYDITDPAAPIRLTIADGSDTTAQDGPTPKRYLLSGPGTLQTPTVTARAAVDLATPQNANTLYIAPAALHNALAPLIAHRRAQGLRVALIDSQAIYDSWSYGQVSPSAIRNFLRYAAATWTTPPEAVTLVGDGSYDPFDYTQKGDKNVNLIPPYLAPVDSFASAGYYPNPGETACDSCYSQLDGSDPLSDLLPDIALGRLPVKSVSDLDGVVKKIIAYESATIAAPWRNRVTLMADNFTGADVGSGVDGGGDFAEAADTVAGFLPDSAKATRVYFDPSADTSTTPWRFPTAAGVRQAALATLNAGSALSVIVGHSDIYHFASIDLTKEPRYMLDLNDADGMTNGVALPVMLQMTCLTSAFQVPAFSGTVFDERWVLAPNGGAIATWGSSGLGVSEGHIELADGFINKLKQLPAGEAQLGTLTAAGYLNLFTDGCCDDALRTFLLLGDPRTPIGYREINSLYLPVTRR